MMEAGVAKHTRMQAASLWCVSVIGLLLISQMGTTAAPSGPDTSLSYRETAAGVQVRLLPAHVHRRAAPAATVAPPAVAADAGNDISAAAQDRVAAAASDAQAASTAAPTAAATATTAAPTAAPATTEASTTAAPTEAPAAPAAAPTAAPAETAPDAGVADDQYDELDSLAAGEHPYHINGTNVTRVRIDDHKYYVSQFLPKGDEMWVDLQLRPSSDVVTHGMLSEAHRRAARVPLPFQFPFYGHLISNITIATGGFLYMGDYLHSWLAATQYIAPLMANFDTTASEESQIIYSHNDSSLTVQWEKVPLQEAGNTTFSFQVTLHKSGDVVFAYRDIPVDIRGIRTSAHPVKVGMSDAYIIDRTVFFVKRKTIYEYHRIDLKQFQIGSHTAVVFKAQPTCVTLTTCDTCLTHPDIKFDCAWCESTGRCSDGLDRYRQQWLESRCHSSELRDAAQCAAPPPAAPPSQPVPPAALPPHSAEVTAPSAPVAAAVTDAPRQAAVNADAGGGGGLSSSAAASLAVLAVLLVAVAGWVTYAYLFPHSTSGQILIRYRPSQWRMRRGEARYTAASIHM